MAPQAPRLGKSGTESSRTTGASSNTPPAETPLQWRHHSVQCNAANAATENITVDAQLKIVSNTGCSNNMKQHPIRGKCSWNEVHGRQLMIWHTAGAPRELHDQVRAASDGKPPWPTKAFVRTVRTIKHHEVVSSAISADEFSDKNPGESTRQALTTSEDATEAYMVEVITESNM